MEAQKPKIALYVQRSFGEKLTATFDFIKENWKPLMKFTTYLMLPLCLLQGLSLNGLMSGTMALGDMTGGSFDSSVVGASIMALVTYYSLYAVLYLLGTVMLTSLVYALVRTYNEREKRLEGVTSFRKQFPGALIATLGWVAVSVGCSIYMDNFTNFSYIYGSMAGIMILLLWLYFCMSMVFYGAEVNYFLENKDNYHLLIRTLRPNWRKQQRAQTEKMRQKSKDERADRKKNKANKNKDENQQ